MGPADLTFHGQNKRLLQQLSAGRFPSWSFNGPLLCSEIGPCRPRKDCPQRNKLPSLQTFHPAVVNPAGFVPKATLDTTIIRSFVFYMLEKETAEMLFFQII